MTTSKLDKRPPRTITCPRCGKQMLVRSAPSPEDPRIELVELAQLENRLHHVYDCGNCQLVVLQPIPAGEENNADNLR